MKGSDDFPALVEQARRLSNAVQDRAKGTLRDALPQVEALQREDSHFSPRLMLVMLSRTEGRLPDRDRHLLRSALRYLEEFDWTLGSWLIAVLLPSLHSV